MTTYLRKAARIAALPVACALALCAGTAATQDTTAMRGNVMAYGAAMKCFVVNGIASGDYEKSNNRPLSSAYEGKARVAFDTALKLGNALGYSNQRVTQDFDLAQTRELPRLVSDKAYYRDAVATCKAIGLM